MATWSRIIFVFMLLLQPVSSILAQVGQTPAVYTLARARTNQILLRWEPSTEPLWIAGIQNGYYVERKTVLRDNAPVTGSTFIRLTSQPTRPAAASTWTPYLTPDSVQHQVLYRLVTGQDTVAVQADSNNIIRQESDSFRRFFFGLLAASQSYSAARLAALGYVDATVQANERYVYRVVLAVPPTGQTINYAETAPIGLVDYTPLPPPMKPKLTFERYAANLKWLHDSLQSPPYISYWVEQSLNGTSFRRVNNRPLVLLNDSTNLYSYKDPVPKGRKTYYYRIVGKTPFDELGTSPVAIGQSKDTLVFAPRIKTLRLQSDNRVYMSWQFPGDTALSKTSQAGADSLLKSYFISVSAKPVDKPVPVKINIDPKDTLAYINNYSGKVPGGSTLYFTLGAVRQDGDTLLSASMFVEPLDTIAPAKPTGLKGRIDSNGQVYLSWNPNEEPDLLGYKVFRSQRKGEEASAVSDTLLVEHSEFTDYAVLNSLNPTLVYQVKALDKHYNISEFSAPLELLKPDIVKPTSPLFISDTLQNGKLVLTWALSSSSDVIRQLLLRRETATAPWQLMSTFTNTQFTYGDASIQPSKSYQYLVVAQDAAGMNSDSTGIRRVEVPASQGASRPQLTAFNAQPDSDLPGIRLSWSYNGTDVSEFQLYRSVGSQAFGLWKMVSGLESSVDDGQVTNGTCRYKIQAVFKDGSVSNWQSASATFSNSSALTPETSPYVARTISAQQASLGKPFTFSIPDSVFVDPDHTGLTIAILSQGLPMGLIVSGNTLSGTPVQAGKYTVTVQGTKPNGYKVATTFSLVVSELPAAIASVPNLTVTIGQSFSYTLPSWVFASVDGQTPQVSILSAGLPSGVTANGLILQGVLSSSGPYSITAQAQTAQGGTSTINWLLVGNRPPHVQTPVASFSVLIGQAVSWILPLATFRDPDGQVVDIRIRALGLPPGLAVRQNQLLGVPTTTGTYTLTIIATDDKGALTETTTQVQVNQATNQLPMITMTNTQIEGLVGDSLAYTLPEGLFFDPDGRINTIALSGSLPAGVARSGLSLKGVPTQSGAFTLTAVATDDRGGSVSTTILLSITGLPAPNAPTLSGSTTVCTGSTVMLQATGCTGTITWSHGATGFTALVTTTTTTIYTATCTSGGLSATSGNSVTITISNPPIASIVSITGSLTISSGNSITLIATGGSVYKWNTGATTAAVSVTSAGVYSATVANSASCSAVASVTVAQANRAPVVANSITPQVGQVGKPFNYSIPSNTFTDPDGDVLLYTVTGLPTGLTATGLTISGTTSTTGNATITITATDPSNLSVSTTLSLVVTSCITVDPYILTGSFASQTVTGIKVANRLETDSVQSVIVNPNASLILQAGQSIRLTPGFVIKPGAAFRAYNGPCN